MRRQTECRSLNYRDTFSLQQLGDKILPKISSDPSRWLSGVSGQHLNQQTISWIKRDRGLVGEQAVHGDSLQLRITVDFAKPCRQQCGNTDQSNELPQRKLASAPRLGVSLSLQ